MSATNREQGFPLLAVIAHGVLAVVTFVLVLLGATTL